MPGCNACELGKLILRAMAFYTRENVGQECPASRTLSGKLKQFPLENMFLSLQINRLQKVNEDASKDLKVTKAKYNEAVEEV